MAHSNTTYDPFSGPAGTPPSSHLWCYNTGGGWPNELQTYTASPANVGLDGKGHLAITAIREPDGSFTSGRIKTEGKLSMGYGLVEARIKFPPGPGILPAFWLLGANYNQVGDPECGEIDIVEWVRGVLHFTIHGPQGDGDYNGNGEGVSVAYPPPFDPTADYHDYWARREPDKITLGVDGTTTAIFTPDTLPAGGRWVFNDTKMFAVLNFAVGGTPDGWPGMPEADTPFPQRMMIDWFRYVPLTPP